MYVREDCYFWFFFEMFHFLVDTRLSVVGTIFFLVFKIMRLNTCRSDFVRYQAKTRKQPCVAFLGQDNAAVRQIASMNDSYGYTIANCVWPHYSSISQLAGVFCNTLTADAGWRRICIYVGQITIYALYYVHHLDPNLSFWGDVQGLYITDPTQATCPRACRMCGCYPGTWARSHRSGIYLPWKS